MGNRKKTIKKKDTQNNASHNSWQYKDLKKWWFVGVIICIALMLRLYHVTYPLLDTHNFRQTQTASVVRNYYKSGINPLTSKLDVFGVGKEENLILEFPFYQTLVALLYKIFYPSEIWGRLMSIFFGFLGAFYLFKLIYLLVDRNSALWSSFFFLFAPLNIYYHRAFMIDTTVVCLSIMLLYYYVHWIKTNNTASYVKGILAASIGFMMKSPYCGMLLLPIVYFKLKYDDGFRGLFKVKFLISIIIPIAIMFIWQGYAESVNFKSGHSFFTMSNPGYQHWFFGKLAYRLDSDYWIKVLHVFNNEVLGNGLIIFFLFGLFLIPKLDNAAFFHLWLLAIFIYILIFFRMVATHHYYNMPVIPIASVYCGYAANYILTQEKLDDYLGLFRRKALVAALVCIIILSNFLYAKPWYNKIEWSTFYVGEIIDKNTRNDVPIIYSIPKWDWDPKYLYYANRRGIYLRHKDLVPEKIAELKKKGYGYLIIRSLMQEIQIPYQLLVKDERYGSLHIYDLNKPRADY
jgi:hypothetical protein